MTDLQRIIKYGALFLAFSIIVGAAFTIISGVDILFNVFDNKAKKLTNGKEIEITKDITKIELDLKSTNLVIEKDKNLSAATNNENISYRIRGNSLIITEKSTSIFNNDTTTDLVIYIPEEHNLEELSLDAGAGKVELYDISVQELELDLGAGNVEIDYLEVTKEATINGGAGNIVINNSTIKDLELDMGIGTLELTSTLLGDNEISCGVGEVVINLIGNDYQIEVDKGIGTTTIAGEKIRDGKIYGEGKNKLEIDGGIGSINIDFYTETIQTQNKENLDY